MLHDWAAQVPEPFTFAIKASQRITHYARLKPESASAVEFLLKNTAVLGARLGPILFQLPPNLKKDLDRLRVLSGDTCRRIGATRSSFGTRAGSTTTSSTRCASATFAMCIIDQPDFCVARRLDGVVGIRAPAPLRLRRRGARDGRSGQRMPWNEAYVYFKHDEGVRVRGRRQWMDFSDNGDWQSRLKPFTSAQKFYCFLVPSMSCLTPTRRRREVGAAIASLRHESTRRADGR